MPECGGGRLARVGRDEVAGRVPWGGLRLGIPTSLSALIAARYTGLAVIALRLMQC